MNSSFANFISSWEYGRSKVTVINEASGLYQMELIDADGELIPPPAPSDQGRLPIGFHVVHIRTPDASILVDAGFDDRESEWGQAFAQEWPSVRRAPGLEAGLQRIGESYESISHVVITHGHFDHVAGLTVQRDGERIARFPNARVLIGREDYEGLEEDDETTNDIVQRLQLIDKQGLLTLVDGDEEVVPGIEMLHTGGESPGHSIVRVSSDGETFLALGDLFHFSCEIEHPEWMAPWVDREKMLASRQRFLEEAALPNTTAMFTHHPFPPWGQVIRSDVGYTWRPGL